jgi:hypothetical protein
MWVVVLSVLGAVAYGALLREAMTIPFPCEMRAVRETRQAQSHRHPAR